MASGYRALANNTTGTNNNAYGYEALRSNTTGASNVAVGRDALYSSTTTSNNTAVGYQALYSATASQNTAVGFQALYDNTTGQTNTAIGEQALANNTTASDNVAVGRRALQLNTSSNNNVAVGETSLLNNTGSSNTAVGRQSLVLQTTGQENVAVGYLSGQALTTGSNNVFLGKNAGFNVTTGRFNTCISPSQAGQNLTTGEFNVYMGYLSNAGSGNRVGAIVIGSGNRGHTDKGNSTGFINPDLGGVYQGNNSSSWSTTSDRRIKKNIVDNNVGLDAINQVQVRNFEYRTEDEITEVPTNSAIDKQGIQLGVIAQEIQAILPDMVKEESTGVLSVNPDNMTWYLVNAVKELSAQITELQSEIATLKGE